VFLLVFLVYSMPPSPPRQATAAVRIERALPASKEWQQRPPSRRREIIIVEQGQPVKVRLVEFE
jgi:hypothetical protein